MKLVLIVAVCKSNRGIGKDNQLLWHLPADMKFFRETTTGYPVITGRKNYESIPEKFRPLPNRKNIVLSRKDDLELESGVSVCSSIDECLRIAHDEGKEKAFVIGGGEIYRLFLETSLVDEMLITWVDADLKADTFFEPIVESQWIKEQIQSHQVDEKNLYGFTIEKYTRKLEQ